MIKPKCALCGKSIEACQHYFIYKRYSLCKECGKKFKGKTSEIRNYSEADHTKI